MRIAEISASFKKAGLRNTMVTSDFRPEVEIWPFRACAMHSGHNYRTSSFIVTADYPLHYQVIFLCFYYYLVGLVSSTCKSFMPLCPVRHCIVHLLVSCAAQNK